MSFLLDSLYSIFARTRNYLVDPPGEVNPENLQLVITGEGRGATTVDATWGSNQVLTTQPVAGAPPVMEAVVTSTTEDARRQQQLPQSSISIVSDSRSATTFNPFEHECADADECTGCLG